MALLRSGEVVSPRVAPTTTAPWSLAEALKPAGVPDNRRFCQGPRQGVEGNTLTIFDSS
jgi:hypothetical protein